MNYTKIQYVFKCVSQELLSIIFTYAVKKFPGGKKISVEYLVFVSVHVIQVQGDL